MELEALKAIAVSGLGLARRQGYDGDAARENLLMQGFLPIIPLKSERGEPTRCTFHYYRDRNRIAHSFGHL